MRHDSITNLNRVSNSNEFIENVNEHSNKVENVVLGSCKLEIAGLENATLELVMDNGEFYHDETPGAFQGDNWIGSCKLILSSNDKVKSELILDDWNEDLRFSSTFHIEIEDYDGDSQYEFLIGQYFSSNMNLYRMYQINKNNQIVNIDSVDYLNISGKPRYSCVLDKSSEGQWYYSYYNNISSKDIEKLIIFDKDFIRKESVSKSEDE